MKKPKEKLYVVRKYIKAQSAAEAIRKERKHPVEDVWIDEEWKKNQVPNLADAIGFIQEPTHEEEDDE